MTPTMPAVFLGHGSPMNAIEDNLWRRSWQALGARLPRPRAICCVSAHWETQGVAVSASTRPPMIYDFHGFPQALFDVQYPAPGDPALAQRIAGLLAPEPVHLDAARGLDHGVWSVLVAMYPDADIPVVQLSLPIDEAGCAHVARGRRLAVLRGEGVLVLGSGNIVHNLRYWRSPDARLTTSWTRFHERVKQAILAGDDAAVADYMSLDPEAALSVPTPEHYLPLLYILALRKPGENLELFNEQEGGAIFMTSVVLGG
jgi:4,5-DOPA dioxygenase extradiol